MVNALQKFKAQCADGRVCLGQPQFQPLAEFVAVAALLAFQSMSGFVENEALRAKGRDRHQPISAQSLHRGEKTEILYAGRSEEHTSELQSLMRISYAVFCLKKKNQYNTSISHTT